MTSFNRLIVVDDTDSRIRYSGSGWKSDFTGKNDDTGTYGPTYKRTLHSTQENDDGLAFSFRGNSIQVYSTTDLGDIYGSEIHDRDFKPPWECFINDASIGASKPSSYAENNQLICSSTSLSGGQQELTIKLDMKPGTTFTIDYITYDPIQPTDSVDVLVQTNDQAIERSTDWQDFEEQTLMGQTIMTRTSGSNIKFTFTGTQLVWIGSIPIDLPRGESTGSYSIDDGPPTTFPLVGLPASAGTTKYNQVFFTTPQLTPGDHTIVVKYLGDSQVTPLTLDHIYLTTSPSTGTATGPRQPYDPSHGPLLAEPSAFPSSTSLRSSSSASNVFPGVSSISGRPAASGSSSSPSSDGVSALSTGSHQPPQPSSSSPLPSSPIISISTRSIPVGAIVGGVIGGVVFIAIVVLIVFLVYSRRCKHSMVVPYRCEYQCSAGSDHNSTVAVVGHRQSRREFPNTAPSSLQSFNDSDIGASDQNNVRVMSSGKGYVSGVTAQIGDSKRSIAYVESGSNEALISAESPPRYSILP